MNISLSVSTPKVLLWQTCNITIDMVNPLFFVCSQLHCFGRQNGIFSKYFEMNGVICIVGQSKVDRDVYFDIVKPGWWYVKINMEHEMVCC